MNDTERKTQRKAIEASIQAQLKKKRLGGKEIGIIVIKDLVTLYLPDEYDNPRGYLSADQKSRLMSLLDTPEKQKEYEKLYLIHQELERLPASFDIYSCVAELAFQRLHYLLGLLLKAEAAAREDVHHPRLLTQALFDKVKEEIIQKRLREGMSAEDLVYYAVGYFLQRYKTGDKTFAGHFESAKKRPLTRNQILLLRQIQAGRYLVPQGGDRPYEEFLKELDRFSIEAGRSERPLLTPDELVNFPSTERQQKKTTHAGSMYNLLENVRFYYRGPMLTQTGLNRFKTDFPDLYADLRESLAKEGIEVREDTEEDYTRVLDIRALYEKNILGIRSWAQRLPYPVAVIPESEAVWTQQAPWWTEFKAETFLREHKEEIECRVNEVRLFLGECCALAVALVLMGELINIPEVHFLIEGVPAWRLQFINNLMEIVPPSISYWRPPGGRPAEELKTELRGLLKPIDIKEVAPTAEAIARARKTLSLSTFPFGYDAFLKSLKEK